MAEKQVYTDDFKETFCSLLEQIPNITAVARLMGVSPRGVMKERKSDAQFNKDIVECIEVGYDTIEEEARRRAVDGVQKPVFYQGEKVDSVTEYSDTLLKELLKAYKPKKFNPAAKIDFGSNEKVHMTINFGGDQ